MERMDDQNILIRTDFPFFQFETFSVSPLHILQLLLVDR